MTAVVPNITRREGAAIYEAMLALTAIEKRASRESFNTSNPQASSLARLATRAEAASAAVFAVISSGNAFLGDAQAEKVLKRWSSR